MYAISRSANLSLPIRDRKIHYHPATGTVEKVDPAVAVQFQHAGTVPEHAREAVSRLADWGRGTGHNEDPFERCGSFDTDEAAVAEGWDAETKAMVEQVLRDGSGTLYVVADAPVVPKPWPNYDALTGTDEEVAERIGRKVVDDGYSPSEVAKYEAQNENRQVVLDVLALLGPQDDLGVISA